MKGLETQKQKQAQKKSDANHENEKNTTKTKSGYRTRRRRRKSIEPRTMIITKEQGQIRRKAQGSKRGKLEILEIERMAA